MRIAILGAGFSGLAIAWHLLQFSTSIQITIFDPNGIGGGASGIAAGLMHPYAGAHAKLNRCAFEGYQSTLSLLEIAEKALGKSIAHRTGLLRIAISDLQKKDFYNSSQKYLDVEWWTPEKCQETISFLPSEPGIFIKSGITVDCASYLNGLWKACEKKGALLSNTKITSLHQVNEFDRIIVTMGSAVYCLPELKNLPLNYVKGQIIEIKWPSDLPALPFSINSSIYLSMSPNKKSCFAGATYERNYSSLEANSEIAITEIFPKLNQLIPELKVADIIQVKAGVRVTAPGHMPLIAQINKKCWILTGLGSKGLLYHGLYAKSLLSKLF